jgi:hypothetical protein
MACHSQEGRGESSLQYSFTIDAWTIYILKQCFEFADWNVGEGISMHKCFLNPKA